MLPGASVRRYHSKNRKEEKLINRKEVTSSACLTSIHRYHSKLCQNNIVKQESRINVHFVLIRFFIMCEKWELRWGYWGRIKEMWIFYEGMIQPSRLGDIKNDSKVWTFSFGCFIEIRDSFRSWKHRRTITLVVKTWLGSQVLRLRVKFPSLKGRWKGLRNTGSYWE